MMANRTLRIAKELADIEEDSQFRIIILPSGSDEDLSHLKISFPGPLGSQYEGGRLSVNIKILKESPLRPPVVEFESKVWHLDVDTQTVCVSPCISLIILL
jgi:ubiquitin-conjugating enzyme (huntingtin interacting protein 2)